MSRRNRRFRGATRGEVQRLAVLALCALALIVAAFAFPGTLGTPQADANAPTGQGGSGGGQGGGSGSGDSGGTGGSGGSSGSGGSGETGGGSGSGSGNGSGAGDGTGGTIEITDGTGEPGSDGGSGGSGDGSVVGDSGNVTGDDGAISPEEASRVDASGCLVLLGSDPKPGAEVAVYVVRDGEPTAGVPVRFDGEAIGRTDARGRVVGRVPYSKPLSVSIAMSGVSDCRFETPSTLQEGGQASAAGVQASAIGEPASEVSGQVSVVSDPASSVGGQVSAVGGPDPANGLATSAGLEGSEGLSAGRFADTGERSRDRRSIGRTAVAAAIGTGAIRSNVPETIAAVRQSEPTGDIPVGGAVEIGVRGRPYPGETVTLVAAVDGVPMRHATVRLDGDRVGRTDASGTYALTVPADGREEVTVTVERGDFAGSGTIDVATLDVAVASDSLVTVPGQSVTATVSIDGTPVSGAPVTVDGERVGTTDVRGEVELSAPLDPTATVTSSHRGMTASAGVWLLYLPLAFAVVLAVGTVVGVTRRYGRRRGALAAGGIGAATLAYAAYRVDGRRGLILALAAMAIIAVCALVLTNHRRVADGATNAQGTLGAFVEWVATTGLRAVGVIERSLARLRLLAGRFGRWLANAPRSLQGILAAGAGAIAGLPAAIGSAALAGLRWLARLPFALVRAFRDGRAKADASEGETPPVVDPDDTTITDDAGDDEPSPISLREAWRRFARRVASRDWRRQTPGEVARAALDQGFPREPVLVLTAVFRDVEYGERPPEDEQVNRAREAFRVIEGDQRGDGEAGD